MLVKETLSVHRIHYTMMTEDDILDSKEQDHLRMNVAPDQTIIQGLQIFLDHRSSSSIGQKILMILPPPPSQSPLFDLSSSLDVV